MGSVVLAQPQQAPQDQGDVGAEHPAVGMRLIDDNELQVAQDPCPPLVRGKDGHVQHVRVSEDEPGLLADACAGFGGGVAVVGGGNDGRCAALVPTALALHRLDEPRGRLQLVGAQRLRRGKVQRAGGGVFGQPGEDGQLIAQRLARGRAGGHGDVAPCPGGLRHGGLVGVGAGDVGIGKRGDELRQHPLGPVGGLRTPRGQRGRIRALRFGKAPLDRFHQLVGEGVRGSTRRPRCWCRGGVRGRVVSHRRVTPFLGDSCADGAH